MVETYTYDALSQHVFSDIFLSPKSSKFTGKERDPESGLDNFGASYDSWQFGRFVSPDSMAVAHKALTEQLSPRIPNHATSSTYRKSQTVANLPRNHREKFLNRPLGRTITQQNPPPLRNTPKEQPPGRSKASSRVRHPPNLENKRLSNVA